MADTEQHFILRVQDAELAARLRGWLRDSERDSDKLEELRLLFDKPDDRLGVLTVDGVQHEVLLQDLPTVVESYKTLDDANLVKITDIGQVLLVVDPAMQSAIEQYSKYSAPDGVTPPMRKARARHFRPAVNLPKAHMDQAVRDVTEMLAGRAPAGYQFQDFEEEYVIDAAGKGSWQQVKAAKQPRAAAAGAAAAGAAAAVGDGGGKARGGRGGAAARRKAAAEDSGDDEDCEMTESD